MFFFLEYNERRNLQINFISWIKTAVVLQMNQKSMCGQKRIQRQTDFFISDGYINE